MARKEIPQAVQREAKRRAAAGESYRSVAKSLGIDHKSVARLARDTKIRPLSAKPATEPRRPPTKRRVEVEDADEFDPAKLVLDNLRVRVRVRNGLLSIFDDCDDPKSLAAVGHTINQLSDSIAKIVVVPAKDNEDDDGSSAGFVDRFNLLREKAVELNVGVEPAISEGPEVPGEPIADGEAGPRLRKVGS